MKMFYDEPAKKWEEALPVGNGRLGAMALMDPVRDVVFLNEDSIWSDKPLNRINPDAKEQLPKIRQLLREGKIREAERLSLFALSGTPNSERSYETAGELHVEFDNPGKVRDYRRELDLETGIVSAEYEIDGTKYKRQMFSSFPEQALFMSIEAKGEGCVNCVMRLDRCHNRLDEVYGAGNEIGFRVDRPEGISFAVKVKAAAEEGSATTIGEHLIINGAKKVFICIAIETSFRHKDYEKAAAERLLNMSSERFEKARSEQIDDYNENLNTMELKFFGDKDEKLSKYPITKRLKRLRKGKKDPALFSLYFMYSRYLLFSSSRGDSLPANLQGIWNNSLTPPWDSKFTININTEMNYWAAESAGLSDCHLPLFTFLERLCENGKVTAREMYGCRGSVAHHNSDIYGDTAPQDHYIPASFWPMGEAFLATHIWEHYSYTQDKDFLKKYLWIIEECIDFFVDFLIEDEDGHLVTSPSVSPENTYIMPDGSMGCMCEGPSMDTQILTELLTGYIKALEVLKEDTPRKLSAEKILLRLPRMQVGKYGQLQEWISDYEELEPGHRHISHLYGVYPGTSISYEKDRSIMKAAKVTLKRRLKSGGGHTGWSRAWIICLWARFLEKEKVYENLEALLTRSTFDNLMDNHPYGPGYVFQIDGNFGAMAGIIEMLVQDDGDNTRLLPALPDEFKDGCAKGIKIRGGRTLSMEWKDGEVTSYEIK